MDPAVLAYRSSSHEPITISVPAAPINLWFEVVEDLRDASMSGYGVGYKQVMALAKQILERTASGVQQRPDDDAVITLRPTNGRSSASVPSFFRPSMRIDMATLAGVDSQLVRSLSSSHSTWSNRSR